MDSSKNGGAGARVNLLELDLDTRLVSVWLQAWDVEEWDCQILGPFLRLAYGTGYRDALTEAQHGMLYMALDQPVPPRRAS